MRKEKTSTVKLAPDQLPIEGEEEEEEEKEEKKKKKK